jgi:hypothetical protein
VSKNLGGLLGASCFPQTVMMRGEWSMNFLNKAAASIHPPLSSTIWQTINLSILDTAEDAPARPLSKVNYFFDSFRILSWRQASVRPYLSVM